MCDVPEVKICYHTNGIIQEYKCVKTEDLPYLNDSEFSTEVVSDVIRNILQMFKSNTAEVGHTYWLFKSIHLNWYLTQYFNTILFIKLQRKMMTIWNFTI